jgi:hypothetical protein
MKACTALVTGLFALASFPLWAQQAPPADRPNSPATQQNPTEAAPPTSSSSASAAAATAEMSPVNGELVSKLDSKTAKNGDSVVVQTKKGIKTPDGTEIPKGSKVVGHVIAVRPSQSGQNSQMALVFDRVELKGGKALPVHSQIQSISPPEGAASASGSPGPSAPNGASGPGGAAQQSAGAAPSAGGAGPASAANGGPAPGTLVGQNGAIAIRTTSIPGVLVANNAPGQQDPRMADASSILLGARGDIALDGGTLIVVGIAPTGAGGQ